MAQQARAPRLARTFSTTSTSASPSAMAKTCAGHTSAL
jgi:hypothetical protein